MDVRHWDPSPATATGYRHRPKLHPAGAVKGKPGLATVPRMAVLDAQAAPSGGPRPAGGFAPPVTAPTASRAPSHATSAAS